MKIFHNIMFIFYGAYRDAINALFYYGILEATNRVKKNSKGVCCKVYIFHADLDILKLPAEKFDARSPEHLQLAKMRKTSPV